jgi:hypothetical protein
MGKDLMNPKRLPCPTFLHTHTHTLYTQYIRTQTKHRGGPKAKVGGMNVPPNFSKIALKYMYL